MTVPTAKILEHAQKAATINLVAQTALSKFAQPVRAILNVSLPQLAPSTIIQSTAFFMDRALFNQLVLTPTNARTQALSHLALDSIAMCSTLQLAHSTRHASPSVLTAKSRIVHKTEHAPSLLASR